MKEVQPSVSLIAKPTPCSRNTRAFTLVELAVALGVTSILLLSMGVALNMTVRAADTGVDGLQAAADAQDGLNQLAADLAVANDVRISGSNIRMNVEDRTDDGVDDGIEYNWDTTRGGPLTRSINGATELPLIADLRSMTITTLGRDAAVAIEGPETLLVQCDPGGSASLSTFSVDRNNWASQYIRLTTLPASAASFRVTRVRIWLTGANNGSSNLSVSLCRVDGSGQPIITGACTRTFPSNSIPRTAGNVLEVDFSGCSPFAPTQALAILVQGSASNSAGDLTFATSGTRPFNAYYISSSDRGSTWTQPADTADIRFQLFGRVTTQQEPN